MISIPVVGTLPQVLNLHTKIVVQHVPLRIIVHKPHALQIILMVLVPEPAILNVLAQLLLTTDAVLQTPEIRM